MSSRDLPEDAWFVALEDQRHGPISASDAWQLVRDFKAEKSAYVWHPLLPQWQTLPSAKPNSSDLPNNGWFVALEDRQHGPISASDAWRLAVDIEAGTSVHVWHPLLPQWQALPSAQAASHLNSKHLPETYQTVAFGDRQPDAISTSNPQQTTTDIKAGTPVSFGHPSMLEPRAPSFALASSPLSQKLNLDEFRLSNARFITWIACGASPLFVLCAALARDVQDVSVSAIAVAVFAYFGWWLYLEYVGLRLLRTEIVFPFRIALWPFLALWIRRIRFEDITGFECWSGGAYVHWFRLHTTGRTGLVALDDALHREILVLALERRLPRAGGRSEGGLA